MHERDDMLQPWSSRCVKTETLSPRALEHTAKDYPVSVDSATRPLWYCRAARTATYYLVMSASNSIHTPYLPCRYLNTFLFYRLPSP